MVQQYNPPKDLKEQVERLEKYVYDLAANLTDRVSDLESKSGREIRELQKENQKLKEILQSATLIEAEGVQLMIMPLWKEYRPCNIDLKEK